MNDDDLKNFLDELNDESEIDCLKKNSKMIFLFFSLFFKK